MRLETSSRDTNHYSLTTATTSILNFLFSRFFDHLGKIFSFVSADLIDKFQNLEKCFEREKSQYQTVELMIEYEKKNKIYMENHNGTLSLLRLIRGLDYLRVLLDLIHQNQDNNKKSHELGCMAYDKTLAFRHIWAVRQLVKTGLRLLPRKNDLLIIMLSGIPDKTNKKENDLLLADFIQIVNKVFSLIHKIYDENDFLELVLA